MKIYCIDDKELLDVKVTNAAVHEEEMMKSNMVRLSWKSNAKISLAVGTYIIPFDDGLKYRLIEPYYPTQDSEDTFTYQPEFQHPIMWLSKVPFTYATKNTLGEDVVQQEWEYTGLTLNILKYAVDFINTTFGFTDKEKFVLTPLGNIDTNVSLSFSSADVLSALSAIANGCKENKCEWHLSWEHKALYFGQVSVNLEETIPTLKVGENIGKASVTQTKDGYYNVFYPQGSTRNMSVKAASGENVSTGIRLGLDKTKYPNGEIDTRDNANEPKQTLAMTFDEVYPHVNCYVYNVRKRTRYLLDDENKKVVSEYNADGSVKSYKTYTVWYMRLAYPLTKQISGKTPIATTNEKLNGVTQTLYWYDYEVDDKQIIDGYTLCGSFSVNTNEGALGSTLVAQPSNGDGFELKYHKVAETIPSNSTSGDSGVTILKGDYEIVFVNQNDTIIPTNEKEGLIPRGEKTPSVKGNIVILYNIAMGDDEVTTAQDELERKTLAEIAYRHSDLNNYAFTAYPNVFAKNNPHLYIGQRVKYDDGNGYSYTTRVLKLTTNLDYDICQEITVGNSTIKGPQTQLKENVQGLISGTISVGSGLSYDQVVDICKNYVSTRYISRTHADTAEGIIDFLKGIKIGGRLLSELFLSKVQDDTAQGIIDFLKGIKIGGRPLSELFLSKEQDDTAQGNIGFGKNVKIKGQLTGDNIRSSVFNSGMQDGVGFRMMYDGKESWLEIDKLTVRMRAIFQALEIRKAEFSAGNLNLTGAGARIVAVADVGEDGKLYNGYPARFFNIGGTWITDNQLALYVTDKTKASNATIKARRCYFEADDGERRTHNLFHVGDMVICQTFNLAEGVYQNVKNKYYWRTCVRTGDAVKVGDKVYHYIDLYTDDEEGSVYLEYNGMTYAEPPSDPDNVNDLPEAGDEVVQLGNFYETDRQHAISLVAVGDAPKIALYTNICEYYPLNSRCVLLLCPTGSYVNTRFLYLTTDMKKTLAEVLKETEDGISSNKSDITDLKIGSEGISTRVSSVEKGLETANSKIQQNADSIASTVDRVTKTEQGLETANSKIQQNADSIASTVDRVTKTEQGLETANSKIQQMPDEITARVTKNVNGELKSSGLSITPDGIEADAKKFTFVNSEKGTPYIKVGVEADTGLPYLIFCDANGKPAYNLGFTGLSQIAQSAHKRGWGRGMYYTQCYAPGTMVSLYDIAPGLPRPQDAWWRYDPAYITGSDGKRIYVPSGAEDAKDKVYVSPSEDSEGLPVTEMLADGWYLFYVSSGYISEDYGGTKVRIQRVTYGVFLIQGGKMLKNIGGKDASGKSQGIVIDMGEMVTNGIQATVTDGVASDMETAVAIDNDGSTLTFKEVTV